MFNKEYDTKSDIHDLIGSRWSGRAYDARKPLSEAQIISLLEAARWAPSCYGDQPWRFIVFDKSSNETSWQQALDCLSEGNKGWAQNAPVLLLSCANSLMSRNGNPNRWGQYDTGAATENLCLQANALGLMTHQMGGFDSDKARALFNIPDQFIPMAMVSVGYQLPESEILEDMKEREYNPRARNPLEEHFFNGTWDKPITINL